MKDKSILISERIYCWFSKQNRL